MNNRTSHALFVCGMLALAACGGGAVITGSGGAYLSPFYSPSLVSYEAQDASFPMVIRGNPFGGVPQAGLEQAIHQNARMPGWAPQARFLRSGTAERGQGLRLVVLFNAPSAVDFRVVCGDVSGIAVGGPANQLVIRATFCDGPQAMSDFTARTGPAPDPTSASFVGALNAAIAGALPFINRGGQGT